MLDESSDHGQMCKMLDGFSNQGPLLCKVLDGSSDQELEMIMSLTGLCSFAYGWCT